MAAAFISHVNVLDSDTSISTAVTIPGGSDYCVVFEGGWASGADPTASVMTLAGTTMLPVKFTLDGSGDGNGIRAYGCNVSTSGSQTFAATRGASWSEGGYCILCFCSGIDQTTAVRDSDGQSYNSGVGVSSTMDVTLTTVSGDLCLVGGGGFNGTVVDVDLVSQTKIFEENTTAFNSDYYGAAYKAATTTSTQLQMAGNYIGAAAVALIPASAASAGGTLVNGILVRGLLARGLAG